MRFNKFSDILNKLKIRFSNDTRKITAICLSLCLVCSTALASVYGTENITSTIYNVAEGTKYIQNQFMSDQSGVGKQMENYYIYTPNKNVVPKLVDDYYLYGKTTATDMIKKVKDWGYYPLMMMNGDFFSLQTGVPMGHQILDGEIITKDSSTQDAIGFLDDSTAFIAPLWIETTVTVNDETFVVENINKYRQPYSLYMLTDKFGVETHTNTPGFNVVIGGLSGKLELNEKVTGVVEDIISTDKSIEIPEGKIIITADDSTPTEKYENMSKFNIGDEVTIYNYATGDERWKDCSFAQASVGGQILKDGQVQDKDEAAAPRTAVGITGEGKIIFYTVDGRQNGYSYGVRLKTLAQRLKELGCIDAINMDGGGSTTLVGKYPGKTETELLNKPSDGKERKVATFFALYNTKEPTGKIENLHIYPQGGNYLTGTKEKFTTLATDTADHPVSLKEPVTYSADGSSIVGDNGTITITGSGKVKISAKSGDAEGSITVNCFANPDDIHVFEGSKQVKELVIGANETVDLWARAWAGNKILTADASCFSWSVTNTKGIIGTVDNDGVFKASDLSSKGSIDVSAGNKTVSIPVRISGDIEREYTNGEFNLNDGILELKLENSEGIEVEKERIFAYLDGKAWDFKYEDNIISINLPEDTDMHKVKVELTNTFSRTSVFNYTTGESNTQSMFTDIENHWAYDYITYMSGQKIVNGFENTDGTYYFDPSKNMTRAEFAVMTANFLGINEADYESVETNFSDEDIIPQWALNKIKALYKEGIMNGKTYGDEIKFNSHDTITRAEVVTVLWRLTKINADKGNMYFTDMADVPEYSLDAFKTMYCFSIINGYEDNTLKPNNNITRAEAVKMLFGIY